MMPAVTRPAGVVRSVALSRPRLPRRSFSVALISSGCAGTLRAWPTACAIGSCIAGIPLSIYRMVILPEFDEPAAAARAGGRCRDHHALARQMLEADARPGSITWRPQPCGAEDAAEWQGEYAAEKVGAGSVTGPPNVAAEGSAGW